MSQGSMLFVTWDPIGATPTGLQAARDHVAAGGRAVVLGHRSQRPTVEAAGVEFRSFRLVRRLRAGVPCSEWTATGLRRDLAEALVALRPRMVVLDEELLAEAGIGLGWLATPRGEDPQAATPMGRQPAAASA
ncbi:MAG TPA: hypothetical protein VD859_04785 [Nocardioides sp.]|nr:hypothetical protein [Nocardioides sp.]